MKDSKLNNLVKTFSRNQYIPYDDIIKVLDEFDTDVMSFAESLEPSKLQEFFYYNCHRFNRFSVPTPFVLENNSKEIFERFLNLLKQIETTNVNTACLDIDRLMWNAFDLISNTCCVSDLIPIIRELKSIKKPENLIKQKEFLEHKGKLKAYISGYLNSSLTTKIQTIIPVCPVEEKTRIESVYKNADIQVLFIPKFYNTPQSILDTRESDVTIPISNSNWQNSICQVEINYHGLLDPITPAPPLSIPYSHALPFTEWPSIFNEVYYIIENISWKLNGIRSRIGRWLVSPSDLGCVKWEVYSNNDQIEFVIKDPPSLLTHISHVNQDTTDVKIENLDLEVPWHLKCLKIAKSKLGIGETNEALFWLNVGIEALFEARSSEMLISNDLSLGILNSGRSYWNSAKELVKKQFPEVADKIVWPEAPVGVPSWYTKIKFLADEIGFAVEKSEILAHYSKINKYRNALFHGSKSARIESLKVEEAIDSYNWLVQNFKEEIGI